MTLNAVMAVKFRYFTKFDFKKPVYQHITVSNRSVAEFMHESLVVRVRYRRKERSCSLSHLLMSFLLLASYKY